MSTSRSLFAGCPLYNATYSLFRLSPLHFRDEGPTAQASLRQHSRRLRDTLKGDGIGSMRLDFDQEDGLRGAGALQTCRWTWLSDSTATDGDGGSASSVDGLGVCEGVRVDIEYERTTYRALLLRSQSGTTNDSPNEIHLPLLLVRMPTSLRQLFLDYISANFDTRTDPMLIPNLDLASLLEQYLAAAGSEGSETLQETVRQVQLTLAFTPPTLRSMDITISQEDVPRFVRRGKSASNASSPQQGPFLLSLADYLAQHMAMDIHHEDISLSRVACGAFALGSEGRAKLFPPAARGPSADATSALLEALLKRSTDLKLDIQ